MRWIPRRKDFKASIARLTRGVAVGQRDKRMTAADHLVIARGSALVDWTELRRIRATFPQVTRTLFRLKASCFPLWNWQQETARALILTVYLVIPRLQVTSFGPVRRRKVTDNTYSYCGGI